MFKVLLSMLLITLVLTGCGGSGSKPPKPVDTIESLFTFNIHYGKDSTHEDLSKYLLKSKGVVLGLQEVSPNKHTFGFTSVKGFTKSNYGITLLTDGELQDSKVIKLPRCGGKEIRVIVAGKINSVWYLNTHLSHITPAMKCQIPSLIQAVNDFGNTQLVLMGDLNLEHGSDMYTQLLQETGLVDAGDNAPSYPTITPKKRIDFIFNKGLILTSVNVDYSVELSDHLPVTAKFK